MGSVTPPVITRPACRREAEKVRVIQRAISLRAKLCCRLAGFNGRQDSLPLDSRFHGNDTGCLARPSPLSLVILGLDPRIHDELMRGNRNI
jgi:hypothetical protein